MEEEIKELGNTLLKIYKNNLIYLKKNHLDIFNKVDKLSIELENEVYKAKYSLEYKDGYFDILNLQDNTWFYNTNSYEEADLRSKRSNFTKDGSLDLLRKGIDGKSLIGSKSFEEVLPILEHINEVVDFDNIAFQKIHKFVFIGSGLGLHINEINKKLDPFITLIIEPELEIFRLSLFVIDYNELSKNNKSLFLSVSDDKLDRLNKLNLFYQNNAHMNYNIKHHLLIKNYEYLYDELVDYFATNTVTSYPYGLIIQNIYKTAKFIKNKDRFLDTRKLFDKKILKDKNVLLISAGPSLDNYIQWIKKHQDKFVIVCVDVILRKLELYNIVPDIVFSIDPSYRCAKYLTTENKNYLKNSTIIMLSQQDDSVMEVVKGLNYYFAQSILLIKEIGFLGSVTNVGAYSFLLCTHLGANKMYTIGNDAAFNQETGSRYANDSSFSKTEKVFKSNKDSVDSSDILELEGNLRKIIKTNRSLTIFKSSFESTYIDLKSKYDDFKVYNLSDGVKLEGFIPMHYDEINKDIQNFPKEEKNIIELMNSVSLVVDKQDFNDDLIILNRILNKLKKHKNTKIKNRNDFLDKKLEIMVWLLEQCKTMSSPLFGNMFLLYTELSDIYINFFLNLRQEGIHKKEQMEKINIIWTQGVLVVLKDIKKAISI